MDRPRPHERDRACARDRRHPARGGNRNARGSWCRSLDSSGTILGRTKRVSIRIRSEYAVDGYFGNPRGPQRSSATDGSIRETPGCSNSDSLLVISGREQTVLNLGGDKINPETVELVLSQFKGIIEAAAFSAPNEFGNDEIYAAVVSPEKLDETALRAHCEARLPRPFVPVRFLPVDASSAQRDGKDRAPRPPRAGHGCCQPQCMSALVRWFSLSMPRR